MFVCSRANREQTYRQIFLEFFFYGFRNPKGEAESFLEYNEGMGWYTTSGKPIDTAAKLRLTVRTWGRRAKPEALGRCPEAWLRMWRRLYGAAAGVPDVEGRMLDLRCTGRIDGDRAVLVAPEAVYRWTEANMGRVRDTLLSWTGGRRLVWQVLPESG